MEEHRIQNTGSKDPLEIRVVYVAWALIKIDNHFLLCEREDKTRFDVPHFVMAGGKIKPH